MTTIYISVAWTKGLVFFEKKKKIIISRQDADLAVKAAEDLIRKTADRVAVSHFGMSPKEVIPELYFEIFEDNKPGSEPIIISDNAPKN